jgi:hypothetical protein
MLDRIPGFISIERSASILRDLELLSLSYWADEAALVQWRSTGEHHAAQQAGRDGIFADYRLRVGPVLSETPAVVEMDTESPPHYNRPPFHSRQFMSIVRMDGVQERETVERCLAELAGTMRGIHGYNSLNDSGRFYFTLPAAELSDALHQAKTCEVVWARFNLSKVPTALELLEVERDYGMEVRGQAPQFFRSSSHPNDGRSS